MNIANYLTIGRIILSPFFLIVYLTHDSLGISNAQLPYILLILFILSELSDVFDGFVARQFKQVTDLGKILDPMADSIARTSAFLTFTLPPVNVPMILIFVFLYRDAVISTLRTVCALNGFALAARMTGKLKAIIQAIAIFIIILLMIYNGENKISTENLQFYSCLAVAFAALYALYSGFDYIIAYRHFIAKAMRGVPNNDL